ncbi:hypothetical protein ACQPZF_27420 [Actinosynnema sp. CS-041913]|uniref:hypothetical protein n=1 Tax=Actinosynnema sp. CS-041913 TaxID=3239917 RepID=UPI003D8E5DA6
MPPVVRAAIGGSGLIVGVARFDHSGRIGERWLMEALGWPPGARYELLVESDRATVSLSAEGKGRIDSRGYVGVRAGTRDLLGIRKGDPVVLVARLDLGVLIIHPMRVVADLVARYYSCMDGVTDGL